MAELLYRIGRIAASRRLAVLASWIAILAVAVAAFAAFGKTPSSEISIPGTPTAVVTEQLAASMPGIAGATGQPTSRSSTHWSTSSARSRPGSGSTPARRKAMPTCSGLASR